MVHQQESDLSSPQLEHSHRKEDIRRRLALPARKGYLRDAVFGAIDGAVTTFAVVSGVSGAGLAPEIIIILGIANLVGDGFSMAAGNFLGTRAENQQYEKLRAIERKHIAQCPEGEREEVRQILMAQGYQGDLLEATQSHITANEDSWIRMMLQFEYGVSNERSAAIPAALTTFGSFLIVGSIPLLPFIAQWLLAAESSTSFVLSSILTAIAFIAVGAFKSRYVNQHWFWSACETLSVGMIAAGLAFYFGYVLGNLDLGMSPGT